MNKISETDKFFRSVNISVEVAVLLVLPLFAAVFIGKWAWLVFFLLLVGLIVSLVKRFNNK